MKAELTDMARARDEAKEKSLFQSVELENEKAKLQEIKDRLEKIRSLSKDKGISVDNREAYAAKIPAVKQELDEQKFRVRALESEWNKTENSVDSYNRKIDASSKKLDELKKQRRGFSRRKLMRRPKSRRDLQRLLVPPARPRAASAAVSWSW